jgi:Ca2+-binding RTX toxin-like protein
MAKIKINDALGELGSLRWNYNPAEMATDMEASGNTKAVYVDGDGGEKIILKGANFAYLDGDLLKGTVEKIIFKDAEGHTTARTSGVEFKAKHLDNLLTDDDSSNLYDFINKMFSGKDAYTGSENGDFAWAGKSNDVIKAFGGNDSVNGEGGNDIMTGGSGSDHFFFTHDGKGGTDVITDFDAKGGGDNQDYIATSFEEVLSIKQVGDDLVLDYGDGDTLTLLDVDKSDFGKSDFHIPI